jgi:hypothetical protein
MRLSGFIFLTFPMDRAIFAVPVGANVHLPLSEYLPGFYLGMVHPCTEK